MNDNSVQSSKPLAIKWIAILMGLTFMRLLAGLQLPNLQMFGGIQPDAWFGPMISDGVLGLLVPYMIYLVLRKRSIKAWTTLVVYNSIGAFDYIHGLITEWTDPLVPNGIMGTPALTYGGVAFSLVVQLVALYLLTRKGTRDYLQHK